MRIPRLIFFALLVSALARASAAEAKPCVFCEIVAGRVPATIIYRDDTVVAFMDNAPINPGHVLVVPVQHADSLLTLPPDTARAMMTVAQKIAVALKATDLHADSIQLLMSNGPAAGQTVFHAHLHVIPRPEGRPPPHEEKTKATAAEREAAAVHIRAQLP